MLEVKFGDNPWHAKIAHKRFQFCYGSQNQIKSLATYNNSLLFKFSRKYFFINILLRINYRFFHTKNNKVMNIQMEKHQHWKRLVIGQWLDKVKWLSQFFQSVIHVSNLMAHFKIFDYSRNICVACHTDNFGGISRGQPHLPDVTHWILTECSPPGASKQQSLFFCYFGNIFKTNSGFKKNNFFPYSAHQYNQYNTYNDQSMQNLYFQPWYIATVYIHIYIYIYEDS